MGSSKARRCHSVPLEVKCHFNRELWNGLSTIEAPKFSTQGHLHWDSHHPQPIFACINIWAKLDEGALAYGSSDRANFNSEHVLHCQDCSSKTCVVISSGTWRRRRPIWFHQKSDFGCYDLWNFWIRNSRRRDSDHTFRHRCHHWWTSRTNAIIISVSVKATMPRCACGFKARSRVFVYVLFKSLSWWLRHIVIDFSSSASVDNIKSWHQIQLQMSFLENAGGAKCI